MVRCWTVRQSRVPFGELRQVEVVVVRLVTKRKRCRDSSQVCVVVSVGTIQEYPYKGVFKVRVCPEIPWWEG